MKLQQHVYLMADYNQWMNQKVYEAVGTLSPEKLHQDQGAFFGSLFATLNHICVGDTIWLKRFATVLDKYEAYTPINDLEMPESLNTFLANNFIDLKDRRVLLDESILEITSLLTDEELLMPISYQNSKGVNANKTLFNLLMHMFNHQTHHRGQVTTLLSQSGIDIGITDLVFIQPNVSV
ncbi:damage-inducible protein DinB [Psychromonas sp. psych-6C06]|uniref:DinB family protein n=1 Tax=Psychromonas sp. psych-6C06 TaxID=2058089 RepID=UPI000C3240DC|nr:DinB family protein [Psychromonas sp. psych-6C06]PKF61127.1 damage-inducible protein DinB [Psychromonas sp. psych-6C06]